MTDRKPDQRRFPRIASQNVVLVSEADEPEADAFARTRELGLGGCCFVLDTPPRAGARLDLSIALGDRVIATKSRVAYVREVEGRQEVGVEFLEVEPVDRAALEALLERSVSSS